VKEEIEPIITVLIQTLMGDDYARSAYNAVRVLNLMAAKKGQYSNTAYERWNVLFYKKKVNGKVVSCEEPDPRLTARLLKEFEKVTKYVDN
jgi:hypothetical protein